MEILNTTFNMAGATQIANTSMPAGVIGGFWTGNSLAVWPIAKTTQAQIKRVADQATAGGQIWFQDIVLPPKATAMLDCEARSDLEINYLVDNYQTFATYGSGGHNYVLPFGCYAFRHIEPLVEDIVSIANQEPTWLAKVADRYKQVKDLAAKIPILIVEMYPSNYPENDPTMLKCWGVLVSMTRQYYPGKLVYAIARADRSYTGKLPPLKWRKQFCSFLRANVDGVFWWGQRNLQLDTIKLLASTP